MMDAFAGDLRHALRGLLRSPGFTAIAVATLALGVGANTAIFSVVNATLLRPLPYPDAQEIVTVAGTAPGSTPFVISPPDFTDYRAQSHSFTGMAAVNTGSWALSGEGPAEQIAGAMVTGDFLKVMGVQPALGRDFTADEMLPMQGTSVLLSDNFWRTRFGADAGIVGRSIRLDGQSYTVAGVMPRGFEYPAGTLFWMPMSFDAQALATQRGAHYLDVVARLKPGVRAEDAALDVNAVATALRAQYPGVNTHEGATTVSLRDSLVGDVRGTLLVLLGAVGFVLLIACVNVANLLLARGTGRRRELAVRAALGASGRRLASILLAESAWLGILGSLGGLALAAWGTDLVVAAAPDIAGIGAARLDLVVFAFALVAGVLTSVLFGLIPAMRASGKADLQQQLRDGGAALGGRGGQRARRTLVVVEVALAVVLVAGAGLLVKSLARLRNVDPGFRADNVLTFDVSLPGSYNAERSAQFYTSLIERLRGIPGVEDAGGMMGLPLSGSAFQISLRQLDGRLLTDEEQQRLRSPQLNVVTPAALRTMSISLASGRMLTADDRQGAPKVLLINEAAARRYFPDVNPVGHQIEQGTTMGYRERGRVGGEIVGVVKDVHDRSLGTDPRPMVFYPHDQVPVNSLSMVVKSGQAVPSLINAVRTELSALDADVPMFHVRPLTDLLAGAVRAPRFFAMLLGVFAGLALLLALIGVYGVMAQSVAERTREIGVRIALGAAPLRVQGLMIRQGLAPAALGVAIGLGGALAATRLLRNLLFQVSPTDTLTFVAVAGALLLTAFAASWIPARRAARVDPMIAMRAE